MTTPTNPSSFQDASTARIAAEEKLNKLQTSLSECTGNLLREETTRQAIDASRQELQERLDSTVMAERTGSTVGGPLITHLCSGA